MLRVSAPCQYAQPGYRPTRNTRPLRALKIAAWAMGEGYNSAYWTSWRAVLATRRYKVNIYVPTAITSPVSPEAGTLTLRNSVLRVGSLLRRAHVSTYLLAALSSSRAPLVGRAASAPKWTLPHASQPPTSAAPRCPNTELAQQTHARLLDVRRSASQSDTISAKLGLLERQNKSHEPFQGALRIPKSEAQSGRDRRAVNADRSLAGG